MFGNNFNPYASGFMQNSMPTGTQPYGVPMNPYLQSMMQQNFNPQQNFNGNNQQVQQQSPQAQVNTNKLYVTSLEDAKNKQLPPNSDYIFLDNDKPLLYRKVVDATGKMEVQAFQITAYEEKPESSIPAIDTSKFVSVDEFNSLKSDLERIKDYFNKSIQRAQQQPSKAQITPSNATQNNTSI